MKIPKEVLDKAHEILTAIKQEDFPEGDWIGISDFNDIEYELNMFIDLGGHPAATLYPVFDGMTDTSQYHELKFHTKRKGE